MRLPFFFSPKRDKFQYKGDGVGNRREMRRRREMSIKVPDETGKVNVGPVRRVQFPLFSIQSDLAWMENKLNTVLEIEKGEGRGKIPEEVKRSLEERDWGEYTKLCHRHNLEPSGFYEYMEEELKVTWGENHEILLVSGGYMGEGLEILGNVTLPKLRILHVHRGAKIIEMGGWLNSLTGLKELYLDVGLGSAKGLEEYRSSSLEHLRIVGRMRELPKLNLPNLKKLMVQTTVDIDPKGLNEMETRELRSLVIDARSIGQVKAREIDWGRYPKLEILNMRGGRGGGGGGESHFTLDNEIERLTELKKLYLMNIKSEVNGVVRLGKLDEMAIGIKKVEVLDWLDLPSLNTLTLDPNGPLEDLDLGEASNRKSLRKEIRRILKREKLSINFGNW